MHRQAGHAPDDSSNRTDLADDGVLRCRRCGDHQDLFVRLRTIHGLIRDSWPSSLSITPKARTPTDRAGIAIRCGACGHEGPRQEFAADITGPGHLELVPPRNPLRDTLGDLIETIEATGGCIRGEGGEIAPVGDPDWLDLADVYLKACQALGRNPVIVESEELL